MEQIPVEYWNKLAQQIVLISSLLGGFSISVVVSLLTFESTNRFVNYTLIAATVAAGSFLACLFCWTDILMMTTEGYPFAFSKPKFGLDRLLGGITLFSGIVSMCLVIALAGWIKSKSIGRFTSTVGFITFLIILVMMMQIS